MHIWFCCVCFSFSVLSLGRTSPKWPIFCRVGCKTTTQSIQMSLVFLSSPSSTCSEIDIIDTGFYVIQSTVSKQWRKFIALSLSFLCPPQDSQRKSRCRPFTLASMVCVGTDRDAIWGADSCGSKEPCIIPGYIRLGSRLDESICSLEGWQSAM